MRAGGLDPYDAGMMTRRPTPAIVQMCDASLRDEILRVLHGLGVTAVAPARSEIESHPPPERPARVTRFAGSPPAGFAVHRRPDDGGGAWTFRPDDVRVVVAGKVRRVGRIVRHGAGGPDYRVGFGKHGLGGAAFRNAAEETDSPSGGAWGANTTRNTRLIETVDLHMLHNGTPRVVRIEGSRVRIALNADEAPRPLAGERTTPRDLGSWLPGVVVDEWFPNFNTPADVEAAAERAGQSSSRLNPIAFDFYSAWIAVIDRTLKGW